MQAAEKHNLVVQENVVDKSANNVVDNSTTQKKFNIDNDFVVQKTESELQKENEEMMQELPTPIEEGKFFSP